MVAKNSCPSLSSDARSKGFVYLSEIDPTILVSLRYATYANFVGKVIDGYNKSVAILTNQAAERLKEVQADVKKDGYCLVVYDAYRPQRAVNQFMKWGADVHDQSQKALYYPRLDKAKVFELNYISKRSGHSRGSTVDVTLIKDCITPGPIKVMERKLLDGFTIKILDDGTVDMGSSFDLFDESSHSKNNLVDESFIKMRAYLISKMEKHSFKNYGDEWWHFTLKNEPYPANLETSYFDFPIE